MDSIDIPVSNLKKQNSGDQQSQGFISVEDTSLNSRVFNNSALVMGEDDEEFHSKQDLRAANLQDVENGYCKSLKLDQQKKSTSKQAKLKTAGFQNFSMKKEPSSTDIVTKRAFSVRKI